MNEISTGRKTIGNYVIEYQRSGYGGCIPVIDGQPQPSLMFGYASESDRAACMKLIEDALRATGNDVAAIQHYIMTAVRTAASDIHPDEAVDVNGHEILISYAAKTAEGDMKFETIREAAEAWVGSFNAIPYRVAEKLRQVDEDDLWEITPPAVGDRVTIYDDWKEGEITETRCGAEEDCFRIKLDNGEERLLKQDEFEVDRDDVFPMWGTLWAFDDGIDNAWLDGEYLGNGLQAMADCGFRIYESEDYEYIFGIDGAGYDFYEAHWIPLYKARGLHWHKEESA